MCTNIENERPRKGELFWTPTLACNIIKEKDMVKRGLIECAEKTSINTKIREAEVKTRVTIPDYLGNNFHLFIQSTNI